MFSVVNKKVTCLAVFLQTNFIPDQNDVAFYKIDHSRYFDKSVTPALCTLDMNILQNVSAGLSWVFNGRETLKHDFQTRHDA